MQTPPMIDATTALLAAVRGALGGAGFLVEEIRSRSWASASFRGARHELALRVEGAGAEAAAAGLRARFAGEGLALRGHILADLRLVGDERVDGAARLVIEALTVEDG